MFAPLLGAVRADIDRQLGWVKGEVQRQTRHTALIAALAGVAALAALGAIVVGLIALYFWLATQTDPFTALGAMGAGLVLLALILFTLALVWRGRRRLAPRPRLQSTQPAAVMGLLRQGVFGDVITGSSQQALTPATGAPQRSSRSAFLGTLVLVAVAGLIAGRRL